MSSVPANLKYTKDHEWARAEGKVATVGITAFACEQLGDIVYVELPKKGDKLKAGGNFGVVESTKAVSDLYSPVTGTVVEVNGALADGPELVNQEPYEKGWMIKVEFADAKELDVLMDAARYEEHVKASAH
jgi:glycine cleavage system H protein